MHRPLHRPLALSCVLGVLVLLLAGTPAAARAGMTFTVTKTTDTNDGACTLDDCSLREAVIAANATPGLDIISLPAGTYTLSIPGAEEDFAATGDLDVREGVTFAGSGA